MASQNVLTDAVENEIIRGMFRSKTAVQHAVSTAKALGDWTYFTSGSDLYILECIVAGTTAATAPAFSTTLGASTVDGTVTWRTHQVGGLKSAIYISLHLIKGLWTASTAISLNEYVVPVTHNGRVYKCTTAGTTAGTEPTWPTTAGGTVADGTVVWTEQTTAMEGGTLPPEPAVGAYGRALYNPSDANWADPVSGDGHTQNLAAISFTTPTADWGTVGVYASNDALTGGTPRLATVLNAPKLIQNGSPVSFPIGEMDFTIG